MKGIESGELFRAVVDCISDGVVFVDTEGVPRLVNRAFCEMVDFSEEELLTSGPPFVCWPEEHVEDLTAIFEAMLAGSRDDVESVFKRKNGERFPVLIHPSTVAVAGEVVGHVTTFKDITEFRKMEQALRLSEQRWRSIAENPFDYVVTLDRDYRYTYVNRVAAGLRIEDLIGKATPFDFIDESGQAVMREAFDKTFREGKPTAYEIHVPILDQWLYTNVGPIFEDGVVTGLSLLTRDVTLQKQAELALRQTQRMEALGRLAGGIAHDFNNLLVPILGNASLLQRHVADDERAQQRLRDIVGAAERARDLVSRILLFGREPSNEREAVRLQDIVGEVERFIRAAVPGGIDLQIELDDSCPPVAGVPGELHQLVTNLLNNAVQALESEGGGTLRVRVEPAPVETVDGGPDRVAGSPGAVRLVVEDTGPGMSEEVRSRIFDPFFTTRDPGKGTGLGLSIVQAVVTRYGGSLTCDSTVGSGTRFVVVLPAQKDPAPAPAPSAPTPQRPQRSLRLLVVDDDPLVLRVMVATFEDAGFQVSPFSDPLAALRHLETHAADLDCVVSDETMPGLTGAVLAERLAVLAPTLPVVLTSGYPAPSAQRLPKNVRGRLQKPVGDDALLDAVRRAAAWADCD
jgi:PAS domain S-box-containing protein